VKAKFKKGDKVEIVRTPEDCSRELLHQICIIVSMDGMHKHISIYPIVIRVKRGMGYERLNYVNGAADIRDYVGVRASEIKLVKSKAVKA
jgi:hypothetical protein